MKLAVFLGGPLHGLLQWVKEFDDLRQFAMPLVGTRRPTLRAASEGAQSEVYRLAFGDAHVGIYYWRLSDFQISAVRQQVRELRARWRDLSEAESESADD